MRAFIRRYLRPVGALKVDRLMHWFAKKLPLRPAKDLRRGAVQVRDASVGVEGQHTLTEVLHDDAAELLGFHAFGDVDDDVADADDLAVHPHRVVTGEPVPHPQRLGRARAAEVHVAYRLPTKGLAVDWLDPGPTGRHDLSHGAADLIGDRQTVDASECLVDPDDAQVWSTSLKPTGAAASMRAQQGQALVRVPLRAPQRGSSCFQSSMSVAVPIHIRTSPPGSRTGCARKECHRYTPSKRRIR